MCIFLVCATVSLNYRRMYRVYQVCCDTEEKWPRTCRNYSSVGMATKKTSLLVGPERIYFYVMREASVVEVDGGMGRDIWVSRSIPFDRHDRNNAGVTFWGRLPTHAFLWINVGSAPAWNVQLSSSCIHRVLLCTTIS